MSQSSPVKSATIPVDAATSVGIRELRDHLSMYLDRVKAGESLTVTEHGRPIARIIGQRYSPRMMELISRGDVTPPTRPRSDLSQVKRVKMEGSMQEFIDEIRG